MKKWYYWLILTSISLFAAIANYLDDRNFFTNVLQILIFLILAVSQYFCDKNGEKGKRFFKYICVGMIIFCVIYVIIVICSIILQ